MNITDEHFLNWYNADTYKRINRILESEDRCAVVQPTGTGKSYIMMKLLHDYENDFKIVIAPSRDFLNTLEENPYWTHNRTLTVTYSLLGMNVSDIRSMLADRKVNADTVKLIITDEMHRAGAPIWGEGLKELIKLCPNAKIVGLTATPKRHREQLDMVKELFNGNLAQDMNLADAINLGIVPKLKYVVSMHTLDYNINDLVKRASSEAQKAMILKQAKDIFKHWSFENNFIETLKSKIDTDSKLGKHIVFAQSIDEANKMVPVVKDVFTKLYPKADVSVYCIHSRSTSKVEDILEFFSDNKENQVKVAISVNMLNESFHSKDIQSISMFRGTQSLNVYMQQIGRAITVDGDVPVIFDFVDNYHSVEYIDEIMKTHKVDSNTVLDEDKYSESPCIFDEYSNRTNWFKAEIIRLSEYLNYNSDVVYKQIVVALMKNKANTIYELEDTVLRDYAEEVLLRNKHLVSIDTNDPMLKTLYSKTFVSIDVVNYLGEDWYNKFKVACKLSGAEKEAALQPLKGKYNMMLFLGLLYPETIEYFAEHGLPSKVKMNEKQLVSFILKYTPTTIYEKNIDRLLKFKESVERGNYKEIKKDINALNKGIPSRIDDRFTTRQIGDCAATKLWAFYKAKYEDTVNNLEKEYEQYKYIYETKYNGKGRLKDIENVARIDREYSDIDSIEVKSRLTSAEIDILNESNLYTSKRVRKFVEEVLGITEFWEQFKTRKTKIGREITVEHFEEWVESQIESITRRAFSSGLKENTNCWSEYTLKEIEDVKRTREYVAELKEKFTLDWYVDYNKNMVLITNELVQIIDMIKTCSFNKVCIDSTSKTDILNAWMDNCEQIAYDWYEKYNYIPNASIFAAIILSGLSISIDDINRYNKSREDWINLEDWFIRKILALPEEELNRLVEYIQINIFNIIRIFSGKNLAKYLQMYLDRQPCNEVHKFCDHGSLALAMFLNSNSFKKLDVSLRFNDEGTGILDMGWIEGTFTKMRNVDIYTYYTSKIKYIPSYEKYDYEQKMQTVASFYNINFNM